MVVLNVTLVNNISCVLIILLMYVLLIPSIMMTILHFHKQGSQEYIINKLKMTSMLIIYETLLLHILIKKIKPVSGCYYNTRNKEVSSQNEYHYEV